MRSRDDSDEELFLKRVKVLDFEFKMHYISQVIKIEVTANYKSKTANVLEQKSIFSGFYSFARCIRKSGTLMSPNQVGHSSFEGINLQVSLKEKLKYGGYRCITLRVHDTKGGDFVENPDLTMVVCESRKQIPLAEVSKEIPLLTSPEGLYKRIDIGVNNYDPNVFMDQEFSVLFLKDSQNYEPKPITEEDDAMGMTLINPDMKTENEIFQERIDKDLMAIGHFSASDIIQHSVFQDEFTQLEPGLFEYQSKKN